MTKLEEAIENLLSCPHCGAHLSRTSNTPATNTPATNMGASASERFPTAHCEKCTAEYPIRDGILDFLSPLDNKANP